MWFNPSAINRALGEEGQQYSHKSVSMFLRKDRETGSFSRKPGSGMSTKITQRVKDLIEEEMQRDNDATASQLGHLLCENGIEISHTTILHSTKRELIDDILQFWQTEDENKCHKYIAHLNKLYQRL